MMEFENLLDKLAGDTYERALQEKLRGIERDAENAKAAAIKEAEEARNGGYSDDFVKWGKDFIAKIDEQARKDTQNHKVIFIFQL